MKPTATYSPEDNKLRLYPEARLDKETYTRVRAAGFIWAPRQELFVAPAWSPEREDLLIEMCGEVGDEDRSLVDRAEERAERFEDYSEKRTADAQAARNAVSRIADGIPLGQPILIGHHSEKHARRDAEKIENGMRRAVKMWETAGYWKSRAAGAIRAAKYKERPDVRARRIKGLEADIRAVKASYTPADDPPHIILQQGWNAKPDDPPVPHVWVGPKGRGGRWVPHASLAGIEARSARWLSHYENRLEYERAMLADAGGLKADGFDIQVGGRVLRRGEWLVVTKLNLRDGALSSVSVIGHWASTVPIEEISEYKPPAEGDAEKVKAAVKPAPLCNFRSDGCVEMTTSQWKEKTRWSCSYYVHTFPSTETAGAYRQRSVSGGSAHNWERVPVFLTDARVVNPPATTTAKPQIERQFADAPEAPRPLPTPESNEFDAMRESLAAGVKVVSAPQLFPTPPDLARRVANAAGILAGRRVLEPSAGTGHLVRAIFNNATGADCCRVVAVEVNEALADGLRTMRDKTVGANDRNFDIRNEDFITVLPDDIGYFDAVLMNPPFADGADIVHVRHAYEFLRPGGRLVAIMCEGPFFRTDRKSTDFREWLYRLDGAAEKLAADTFEDFCTSVSTRLVVLDRPATPESVAEPLGTAVESLPLEADLEAGLLFAL